MQIKHEEATKFEADDVIASYVYQYDIQTNYGILPEQYVCFKSMVGDSADNIKGAEKIGIKTASALLNQYGSLQNVITNADKISKPSIRESILRNKDRLLVNFKLIKLGSKQIPIYGLDYLTYKLSNITTREALRGIGLLR